MAKFHAVPPPDALTLDGVAVVEIARAPDGRFYVVRSGASTKLVDGADVTYEIQVAS
mgnify:CR=1 FL=1